MVLICSSVSPGGLVKPDCWAPLRKLLIQWMWDGTRVLASLASSRVILRLLVWSPLLENHWLMVTGINLLLSPMIIHCPHKEISKTSVKNTTFNYSAKPFEYQSWSGTLLGWGTQPWTIWTKVSASMKVTFLWRRQTKWVSESKCYVEKLKRE